MYKRISKRLKLQRFLDVENFIEMLANIEYYLFGYPKIINQNELDLLGAPIAELDKCKLYVKRLTWQQVLNFTLCSVIFIKNLQFPKYTVNSIEGVENMFQNNNDTHRLQFACLETNCTTQEALRKFITLPVFPICKPQVNAYHTPLIGLHSFGLIIHNSYTIFLVAIGIVLLSFLYFRPTNSELFMFTLAPELSRLNTCEMIRRNLVEVHCSMLNYCEKYESQLARKATHIKDIDLSLSLSAQGNSRPDQSVINIKSLNYEQRRIELLRRRYIDLDQKSKEFIIDTLTIFRTDFWRRNVLKLIMHRYLFLVAVVLIGISNGMIIISSIVVDKWRAELELIIDEFGQSNCPIRNLSNPSQAGIDILPELRFSLLFYLEVVFVLFPNLLTASISLARFPIAISELNSMIAEQMDRIYLAIEITEILILMDYESFQSTTIERNFEKFANMYNFEQLKQMHKQNINTRIYVEFTNLRSYKYRNDNCIENEGPWQVAMNMVSLNGASVYAYENLLIKIYLGNRFITSSIVKLGPSLELVMLALLFMNYGGILVAVYFNRKFHEISVITITFYVVGILTNSFTSLFPSSVRAFSKHMINLMWRLQTLTRNFNDIRVRHLRTLLLKQIVFMSQDEGLSIKAFGIPVSYETVVKLALLSCTLMVISFSG